jgi:hypothetical protein
MRTSRIGLAMAFGVVAAVAALAACEKAAPTKPPPPKLLPDGIEVPEVAGHGLAAATDAPAVVVSMTAILVEGAPVIQLAAGKVGAADKEGSEQGLKIPALTQRLGVRRQAATGSGSAAGELGPLVLALDRAQTYGLLYEVLFSAKPEYKSFSILVRAGTQPLVVPITLPERRRPTGARSPGADTDDAVLLTGMNPADQPVAPVIAVTDTRAILWSMSGLEGDLRNPKASVPLAKLADLGPALAEIVTRRWGGKPRTEQQEELILMCEPATSMQTVAELAQLALAPGTDGKPVFPRLILSMGFE